MKSHKADVRDFERLARRTFLTRALALGAVGGLGLGFLAWRREADRRLIEEFGSEATPLAWRTVGERVVDTPPPADAWRDAPLPGTPGSAMPFAVDAHAPLVSELTNRLHWERHYRVYAGRLRAAAGALVAAPSDEARAAGAETFWRPWMQALLHRLHWGAMPASKPAAMRAPKEMRRGAALLDERLPRHDGFITLLRQESGEVRALYSSEPSVVLSAAGTLVHAVDGHRHAWSYDGSRADWLAAWCALTGVDLGALDVQEIAGSTAREIAAPTVEPPTTSELIRILSLVAELPEPVEPIAVALENHTPAGLGESWIAHLAREALTPTVGAPA